jgi:hypothetical protein
MKPKKFLFLFCLSVAPLFVMAEEQKGQWFPTRDEISFAPSSEAAFDRSGKLVSHKTLAGGALIAEHNGSLGNVTIARLGPDGKVETFCTTDEEAAKSWMSGEEIEAPIATLNIHDGGQ